MKIKYESSLFAVIAMAVLIISFEITYLLPQGAYAWSEPTPTYVDVWTDPIVMTATIKTPVVTYVYHDTPTPYPEPVETLIPVPAVTMAAYPEPENLAMTIVAVPDLDSNKQADPIIQKVIIVTVEHPMHTYEAR